MKKTLILIAIAALAAGTAYAQPGQSRGPMRGDRAAGDCDLSGPGPRADKTMPAPNREMCGGPMSEEMRTEMRAEHQAIRDLAGAARVETDEAQKAQLVDQLRAKLGAVADRMQAHQKERLAQAEERLTSLKDRIANTDANRDTLIEEQIQRLLSGERPRRPAAFDDFPYAKGGHRGHAPSAPALDEDTPPPAAE